MACQRRVSDDQFTTGVGGDQAFSTSLIPLFRKVLFAKTILIKCVPASVSGINAFADGLPSIVNPAIWLPYPSISMLSIALRYEKWFSDLSPCHDLGTNGLNNNPSVVNDMPKISLWIMLMFPERLHNILLELICVP